MTVLRASVESRFDSAGFYRKQWYGLVLEYEYEAGGAMHRSNRLSFDERSTWYGSREEAESLLQEVLARGTCFYSPKNPRESVVLVRLAGHRKGHYAAVMIGGVLVATVGLLL